MKTKFYGERKLFGIKRANEENYEERTYGKQSFRGTESIENKTLEV